MNNCPISTHDLGPVEIQIGDDLFITPVTAEEREGSMLYSNHSCDANLGVRGNIVFVAVRNIRAGEELTHDWCTTDDDNYSVECKCGSPNCRKLLTGKDWQKTEATREVCRLLLLVSATQGRCWTGGN